MPKRAADAGANHPASGRGEAKAMRQQMVTGGRYSTGHTSPSTRNALAATGQPA